MLVSSTAEVVCNSRNKKHYVDLGYEFTGMKNSFEVKVDDLTNGSQAYVTVKCDYCGNDYTTQWYIYLSLRKKTVVKKDCCCKCLERKAADSVKIKYGSHSEMNKASDEKRRSTNLKRYGSENPFGSDEIKRKIVSTNIDRYGVPYTQSSIAVRSKTVKTCQERYGVDNYVELFKGKYIGENSPTWKGGVEHTRTERATYDYTQWRKSVFDRDKYTYQKCGSRNGNSKSVILNAHHILNWKDNEHDRYNVGNGITLCSKCHNEFHSIYGKRNNDQIQLDEFMLN